MKSDWYFKVSGLAYFLIAVCLLLILSLWTKFSPRPIDGIIIGTGIFLACICIFFGYRVLRAGSASFKARRSFAIYAGIFCGSIAGIAGWVAGIIFGVPLLIALLGMPEMWKLQRRKEQEKV